jgi:hypothetical protein
MSLGEEMQMAEPKDRKQEAEKSRGKAELNKKLYVSPALKEYGPLAQITRGSSGSKGDGTAGKRA